MKKLFASLAFILFVIACSAQQTIVLKRPIWFYKRMDSPKGRIILTEGTHVLYHPDESKPILRAFVNNKTGYIESVMISDAYQNGELNFPRNDGFIFPPITAAPILAGESPTPAQLYDANNLNVRLERAGSNIRSGANLMIVGSILSLGAAVTSSLLAVKNPEAAAVIGVTGGGLGLIISIAGIATISNGGKTLQGY